MGSFVKSVLVFGVSVLLAVVGVEGADAAKVEQVMAGEIKEAHVSWWGFDKEDSTAFLRAAIKSRVPKLIVDNMGAPWITDHLQLVSNQEIIFEKGVEVVAKRGAFKSRAASMINLVGVENVTLRGPGATIRMHRADYDAPPYVKAEWRHLVCMRGCTNIKILGLTLAESGGDGIYLGVGSGKRTNLDIEIRDVVCDRHYRQGISVITAENLLIENTIMRDTAGTPPAAGIDFEPNNRAERLKNCVVRNCLTQNNEGIGFHSYLYYLKGDSEPVSIEIINCRSIGDRMGANVVTGNSEEDAVKGFMRFENCTFSNARQHGISVGAKPAEGMALEFQNCVIEGCGASSNVFTDLNFVSRPHNDLPPGGVKLDNLVIRQPVKRDWVQWQNKFVHSGTISDISGRVTVECGDAKETFTMSDAWFAKRFPPRFAVPVRRVRVDLATARVVNTVEGPRQLARIRMRGYGNYLFYATGGKEVVLKGRQSKVGRNVASTKMMVVKDSADQETKSVALSGKFDAIEEVRFMPSKSGFYRLSVAVDGNAFALLEANVPVALDTSVRSVNLINSPGPLYAVLPQGTGTFAFGLRGQGSGERVKATVIDPNGREVWTHASIAEMERYTAANGEGAAGGIWQVKFATPTEGVFEDFSVELLGAPAYLFLDDKCYWSF